MYKFPTFKFRTLAEIEPGDCFGFFPDGQIQIGLLLGDMRPGRSLPFIVIWSSDQKLATFSLTSSNRLFGPLIVFEGARVVLPIETIDSKPQPLLHLAAGAIYVGDSALGIAVQEGTQEFVFNIADGSPMGNIDLQNGPRFTSWSLEVPDSGGLWRRLCKVG